MFGGRVVGIVPFSVVEDDACEIVAFASVASKAFPSRLFPGLEFVDYTVEKTGEGQFGRFVVGRRWRRSGALAVGGVGVPAQCFEKRRRLRWVFEDTCDAHSAGANRANKGVDLPYLKDELSPFLARDAGHGVAGQLDDFDCVARLAAWMRRVGVWMRIERSPLVEGLAS